MTKLYLVEGLPCSGKSTTAKFISEKLSKMDKSVILVDEGSGKHPADFEFHAYVDENDLNKFDARLQIKINQCSEHKNGGYIIDLSQFADEDLDQLIKYKIYDVLPWEVEMPQMINRWQDFAKKASHDEIVYVFNCVFLQNPMCETMMRFNFSESESFEYIFKIYQIISSLNPTVIYLKNDDIVDKVKETAKERKGWLDAVIDYHINGGYGKSIDARGFDGYISCLEERQCRELAILEKLPIKKLIVNNAHRDWKRVYNEIMTVIDEE